MIELGRSGDRTTAKESFESPQLRSQVTISSLYLRTCASAESWDLCSDE